MRVVAVVRVVVARVVVARVAVARELEARRRLEARHALVEAGLELEPGRSGRLRGAGAPVAAEGRGAEQRDGGQRERHRVRAARLARAPERCALLLGLEQRLDCLGPRQGRATHL
jgi:hypothetical protein